MCAQPPSPYSSHLDRPSRLPRQAKPDQLRLPCHPDLRPSVPTPEPKPEHVHVPRAPLMNWAQGIDDEAAFPNTIGISSCYFSLCAADLVANKDDEEMDDDEAGPPH